MQMNSERGIADVERAVPWRERGAEGLEGGLTRHGVARTAWTRCASRTAVASGPQD